MVLSKRETRAHSIGTKSYLPDPEALLRKQKLCTEKSITPRPEPLSVETLSIFKAVTMEQHSKFKMPLPDSRDASKFKHTEPSEVRQFLQRMESLFEHAGIKDTKEKKKRILEYVDAQTEQEWLGFDSYGAEYSWVDFTKEIKESYLILAVFLTWSASVESMLI